MKTNVTNHRKLVGRNHFFAGRSLCVFLAAYVGAFYFCKAMGTLDDDFAPEIWAFGGYQQTAHVYWDATTPNFRSERARYVFFFPLIKFDALCGAYHVWEMPAEVSAKLGG